MLSTCREIKRSFIVKPVYILAAAALCACASPAPKQARPAPYLPREVLQSITIPPAPEPGSEVDKADLAVLFEWQKKRTEKDCAQALSQKRARYEDFFGEAGPFEVPLSSAPALFFGRLYHELYKDAVAIKDRYSRPRPYQRDAALKSCLGVVQDSSYPSGHAVNSRFFADALTELQPQRREEFIAVADRAALNRVIGGVHHPSDIEAGKRLGDLLFAEYMKRPAFRADLEALRKHLKPAGPLP